jgi:hypothetical protein
MRTLLLYPAMTLFATCSLNFSSTAQTVDAGHRPAPIAVTAPTVVPALVLYTGLAATSDGRALSSETSMTFLLFKDEAGGEPLWAESQTVEPDATGRFSVQLGASSPSGLPLEVFSTGAARWLEVQVAGQKPQSRVLMATVPYAAKAADAATLGGLPPSAFVLAGSATTVSAAAASASPDAGTTVTTTGGTATFVPLFNGASSIVNSEIVDTGTSVGIGGVPNAGAKLDVKGSMIMRGNMIVSRAGNATTSKGYPSYGFDFYANAYNSPTKTTYNPYFSLQSEPTGNNTTAPSATFNLLFSNTGVPTAETGLYFNPNGTVHFATGQTFPGTGPGTITGVTAGTGLSGGGTSGAVTLKVDTTKVPSLSGSNTFAGTQTISTGNLNLPATTSATSGVLNIGGVPFLHGFTASNQNVFVGGAGNFSVGGNADVGIGYTALQALTSGYQETATGAQALQATTTGIANTADGTLALYQNTTGADNTAVGAGALASNTSGLTNTAVGQNALVNNSIGNANTAIGLIAGPTGSGLVNTTAVGAHANVAQDNSLVLGNTTAGSPGASFVNVGIGTATPSSVLEASVSSPGNMGPVLTLSNPVSSPTSDTGAGIIFRTSSVQVGAAIQAYDDGTGHDSLSLSTSQNGGGLLINPDGSVAIPYTLSLASSIGPGRIAALTIGTTPADATGTLSIVGSTGYDEFPGISSVGSEQGDGGLFIGGNNTTNQKQQGFGIEAYPGTGPVAGGFAAVLHGDVDVDGTLSASAKNFKIDHPTDPANKYLVHASVESSEMMNIYSGNITTDDLGIATVKLPAWFEAENTDFRYQLTTIGRDAHAWISAKVKDGKFMIGTNAPLVEVSWQITAVRQDAYAKAYPLVVEQDKPARERGFYSHPELYGQPEEKQTEWGSRPEQMRRLKAIREKQRRQPIEESNPTATRPALKPASAVNRNFASPVVPVLRPSVARPVASLKH